MTFISFTEAGNRIGGSLRAHRHTQCTGLWWHAMWAMIKSATSGSFVVARFYVEHDFGTRPASAGSVEADGKLLLYPPVQPQTDASVEFFSEYWLALHNLALENDAVFPIEYALEYPGGESGNSWRGFLSAIRMLELDVPAK